ncbi:hypothetical protein Q1695_002911 [Nippostrongylus brasiliensis]|nr:hypothetical protein Q1695_002911 [Nippostrongylus brasiliensis]
MLLTASSSYSVPKLHVDDHSQTPTLLSPDTLSQRDQQIKLYCQTMVALIRALRRKSLNRLVRLERRIQRVLQIQTQIDFTRDEPIEQFERNLQLFVCVVDHRLRTLAIYHAHEYLLSVSKLQLMLIDSGAVASSRAKKVQLLKKILKKVLQIS